MDSGDNKQLRVTRLMVAGVSCFVGGILLTAAGVLFFSGAWIVAGLLLIPIGVVLAVIALASGWGEAFGDPSKKPVQRANDVYVIAKVIADKRANPVIDPEFHDPSELRYLVQFNIPGKGKVELETSGEVFNGVGEGMNGDIVYQGRWLSQFTFKPRPGDRQFGEDPFAARRQ